MRIGRRQFSIPLWALCLYLVTVSCMLWLANWQLDRAALKKQMQLAAEQAVQGSAVPLQSIADPISAAASYRRVIVEGDYLAETQFLWDNRTHKGRAGYEVISPIRLENNSVVLINRGWIALGRTRAQLPDITLPGDALNRPVRAEGFLSVPSKGFAQGDALEDAESWPRVLQYFDYDAIAAQLGEPVLPVIVQMQASGADPARPTVLTSRPEWLVANWQPAASGPAKHYSYAFQWYAMAAALTILLIVVNTRRREESTGHV